MIVVYSKWENKYIQRKEWESPTLSCLKTLFKEGEMMKKVTDIITKLVLPIVEELQLELVDVLYVKEGSNWFLRIFIDSEEGIDIEQCGMVSEKLSEQLDEMDPIEHNYFLEVSSPGAERPLRKPADFTRYIGRNVFVKTYEPWNGEKEFEGELTAFDGELVTVTVMDKTREKQVAIPYAKVANARLAVVF